MGCYVKIMLFALNIDFDVHVIAVLRVKFNGYLNVV